MVELPIFRSVIRVGSSWAAILPRYVCEATNIKRGDKVQWIMKANGVIEIRKVTDAMLRKYIKF